MCTPPSLTQQQLPAECSRPSCYVSGDGTGCRSSAESAKEQDKEKHVNVGNKSEVARDNVSGGGEGGRSFALNTSEDKRVKIARCQNKESNALNITTTKAALSTESSGVKDTCYARRGQVVMPASCCTLANDGRGSCLADEDDNDDDDDEDDDSTLCDCCIPILFSIPFDIAQHRLGEARKTSKETDGQLPRCCLISQQSCCTDTMRCDDRSNQGAGKPEAEAGQALVSVRRLADPSSQGTVQQKEGSVREHSRSSLQLVVAGMDCADCAPRVKRAAETLASVRVVNLDYFQGIVDVEYDAEQLDAAAIIKFVTRATGFETKVTASRLENGGFSARQETGLQLTLHYVFDMATVQPDLLDSLLHRWDAAVVVGHRGSSTQTVSVTFATSGVNSVNAREVHECFSSAGGSLVAEEHDGGKAGVVRRDVINVTMRVVISIALSIPILVFAWTPSLYSHKSLRYEAASLVLATLLLLNSYPMLQSSVRSILFLRQADLMVLASVSITVAWGYSTAAFFARLAGNKQLAKPFFETVALLTTLIYVGRLVQASTRLFVVNAVHGLKPDAGECYVNVLSDQPAAAATSSSAVPPSILLDTRLLQYGDIISIPAGAGIPIDGLVAAGSKVGAVDESFISGESVPVYKSVGSRVLAGSRNTDTELHVQVTQLVHETSLVLLSHSVTRAFSSRSALQDLSDRMAAVLLPVAVVCASIAFLTWSLVERLLRNSQASVAGTTGLGYAIATLVVSCPCPLALCVPLVTSMSILTGVRAAGVLYRSSNSISHTAHASIFAFDKTGTLSTGTFEVVESINYVSGCDAIVAALTFDNGHPVAQSVRRYICTDAQQRSLASQTDSIALQDIKSIAGKGFTATLHGFPVRAGSVAFTNTQHCPDVAALIEAGLTVFVVTVADKLVAAYGLQDQPKAQARALVAELRKSKNVVALVSGDNDIAARRFAANVGIDPRYVFAPCLPEEKAQAIVSLRTGARSVKAAADQRHSRFGLMSRRHPAATPRVAFIGDGTNDTVAFGAADVSFALASGSDLACASADVLLLGSDIHRGLRQAIRLACISQRCNIVGLVWCSVYATVAILLATGATVRFSLAPQWAGLGELVSVLPIVAIAFALPAYWRLRRACSKP